MSNPAPTAIELKKNRPHRFDPALQGHKLTISYRGTDFSGWQGQRQAGKRTVQESIEAALEKIWGAKISLQGSGRTDTGVHARGQVASFNAPRLHNATVLVWNHLVQDPFTLDTHWHVPRPLDLPAMRRAARMLLGRHDFASFTSNPGYERESTVRIMKRVSVVRDGAQLVFHFTADGFLYRMVRNLVGGLIKVGLGKMTADDLGQILKACSRSAAPANAPACGLYLMNVTYPPNRTYGTNRTDRTTEDSFAE